MRTFLKNQLARVTGNPTRREIAEILDTDEDRVINQYNRYLNYINNIKKDIMQKSAEFVGYKKKISLQ
jgi:hypothetical protein